MSAKATSRARAGMAALLGIAAVCLVAPPARAQSLADVARKEEERRKTIAAPAKVYTNKDLNAVRAGSPTASTPAPAKPADEASKAAEGAGKGSAPKTANADDKAPAKDQKYWFGHLKALQDKLARDQDYADAMQTRINALTTDFVNRDDPAQRAVIGQNRQKSIAELARLTTSVQDTKKAIADFLEEARRAGVPPGWLR